MLMGPIHISSPFTLSGPFNYSPFTSLLGGFLWLSKFTLPVLNKVECQGINVSQKQSLSND